jgi:hypothetical protein
MTTMFDQLEKKIKSLMLEIKLGKTLPKDSGIGKWFAQMKNIDIPAYESLMAEYKTILGGVKKAAPPK